MTEKQVLAAKMAVHAVLATLVELSGDGPVATGMIFVGLQAQGCTLEQFNSLMARLEDAGLIRRDGLMVEPTSEAPDAVKRLGEEIATMKRSMGLAERGVAA